MSFVNKEGLMGFRPRMGHYFGYHLNILDFLGFEKLIAFDPFPLKPLVGNQGINYIPSTIMLHQEGVRHAK